MPPLRHQISLEKGYRGAPRAFRLLRNSFVGQWVRENYSETHLTATWSVLSGFVGLSPFELTAGTVDAVPLS